MAIAAGTPMDARDSGSDGIRIWAQGQAVTLEWQTGEGDRRLRGWRRDDGWRAIDTNGDPIFEDEDGFSDAWEAGEAR